MSKPSITLDTIMRRAFLNARVTPATPTPLIQTVAKALQAGVGQFQRYKMWAVLRG